MPIRLSALYLTTSLINLQYVGEKTATIETTEIDFLKKIEHLPETTPISLICTEVGTGIDGLTPWERLI